MRLVDRLGDARSIAMLGFDSLREPDIGGAHLEFERLAATGEVGFDPLEFLFLLRGQVELAVEKRMKFGFACFGRIGHQTRSEENTSEFQSLMSISYAFFFLKTTLILLFTHNNSCIPS